MGKLLKNIGLSLFLFFRLHQLFRYLNKDKALILMYHGFTDKSNSNGFKDIENIHLDINKFESQVKYLTSHFNVIHLETIVDCLEKKKPFPPRSVAITIDDGYESNYNLAFGVLKKYNCPAIIFLTTDFVNENKMLWTDRLSVLIKKLHTTEFVFSNNGHSINEKINTKKDKIFLYKKLKKILKNVDQVERDKLLDNMIKKHALEIRPSDFLETNLPLNWEQVKEMLQSKLITFGGHTCSHPILGKLSDEKAFVEISESKKIIEQKTGEKCDIFCYPNGQPGDYTETTKKILRDTGFRCSLTTVQSFVTSKSDIFELERIYVSNKDTLPQFIMSLSGMRFKNKISYLLNLIKV